LKINISENEALDVTPDYKVLLKIVSDDVGLPIERLVIEQHPCGEGCIFDARTGRWLGYISEYL
tara:strand:- start:15062 stop:15253 length:192 start_codon:yes stop_codon:yes gene_type:complete